MARLLRKKAIEKKRRKPTDIEQGLMNSVSQDKDSSGDQSEFARKQSHPEVKKIITTQRKISSESSVKTLVSKWQWLDQSIQFLREVRIELKKVTWPSRKQAIGSTLVVIILVMIFSVFLGIVDVGLSGLVRILLK